MPIVEEHVSPDGRLRFLVATGADGLSLGFKGFAWHTHGDVLASLCGLPEAEAVRRYVDRLLGDKAVVALWGVPGEVRDVWVSEEPARDSTYPTDGEVIELRYWSGRPWGSDLPPRRDVV